MHDKSVKYRCTCTSIRSHRIRPEWERETTLWQCDFWLLAFVGKTVPVPKQFAYHFVGGQAIYWISTVKVRNDNNECIICHLRLFDLKIYLSYVHLYWCCFHDASDLFDVTMNNHETCLKLINSCTLGTYFFFCSHSICCSWTIDSENYRFVINDWVLKVTCAPMWTTDEPHLTPAFIRICKNLAQIALFICC